MKIVNGRLFFDEDELDKGELIHQRISDALEEQEVNNAEALIASLLFCSLAIRKAQVHSGLSIDSAIGLLNLLIYTYSEKSV